MNSVNSISRPEKVFETSGSQPALILCDDINFYVCKYNRQPGGKATKLFHELLAGHFAKLWELAVPDFKLVHVSPEHIGGYQQLQPAFFSVPCFGSQFNSRLSEVDEFYGDANLSMRKRFGYRHEFLKIALFDIWLANEDRNFNNYNLLIDIENQNRFVPIDHDAIFNTGNLDKGLVLLSENETLICTDLTGVLFSRKELCDQKFLEEIKNEYYICISKCEENLNQIVSVVPEEWNINITDYQNLLKENLFNKAWSRNCFEYFLELIQLQR
ncbi:HipA family kinase [Sunxiuqinia indica]|uniref:HipA family kinase n=1 Tax=Sunxiuqinia indica TaxID=2692584 RepID=UPI001358F65C|nr:HipA family kinase [Sunxiuqinia indica]